MACQSEESENAEREAKSNPVVNVYSYRQENLIKPALDNFSRQTGIQVNLVTGKADALFQRLKSEGANSPADVLITADAGRLYRAKEAGLLQAIESDTLNQRIPTELRDSDNQWYGLSRRARVVFYNKEAVDPAELGSYLDLTDEQWEGRICIRSSGNIYNQSLLASMIAHHGSEVAKEWAAGMVANMARDPQGGDRDQLKGAAVGVCDIAVANTYYYGSWVDSADETDRGYAARLGVHYPNQGEDGHGAHINVSGAGVTRHAPNREAAVTLIEYLSGDEAQQFYASANHEYPVVEGVAVSDIVKSWGYPFKADDLSLNQLGQNNAEAVRIFDQVGWK
ncbi:MAG: Fe(3+) ABC transporter substrate-binding protein [Pseudomonadota bacterium]